jgi:DNA-directed RNA polymerase
MTTVYGVTFVGAREQIERQLRIAEIVDPDVRYQCAAYLANVVGVRLGSVAEGASHFASRHFAVLAISSEGPRISRIG